VSDDDRFGAEADAGRAVRVVEICAMFGVYARMIQSAGTATLAAMSEKEASQRP